MENLKIIISVISLIITIIAIAGGYFFVKFQTVQNTKDINQTKKDTKEAIEKIEEEFKREMSKISADIREMRITEEKRTGDIYNLMRSSGEKILEKLDEIKKDFVSKQMCDSISDNKH